MAGSEILVILGVFQFCGLVTPERWDSVALVLCQGYDFSFMGEKRHLSKFSGKCRFRMLFAVRPKRILTKLKTYGYISTFYATIIVANT